MTDQNPTKAETTFALREELDETRAAYEHLVELWSGLKRSVRQADLPADFSSLYDRLAAYVPDSLGDVGSGQDFGGWLDEIDTAIENVENADAEESRFEQKWNGEFAPRSDR